LGAFNLNYNPSKEWRHSGFIIGSTSENRLGSNSQRTYLRSDENNQETLTSASKVENASGLMKYAVTYTPKEETYVKYSIFGKMSDIQNRNIMDSDFGSIRQQIDNIQSRRPYSVQQKAEWYHAPNEKQVFSMELNWEKKYQDPLYDLTTNQKPFMGLLPILDQESYRFLQRQQVHSRTMEGAFNYYQILNATNHLNWSLGYSDTRQDMISDLSQVLPGSETSFSEFENDNRFGIQDLYLGMTYKTKWKDFILSPTIYAHRYAWQDRQFEDKSETEKYLFLPGMYAKWAIKSNRSLTYRYQATASFMDVQKLAEGYVIQDYNSIFTGNRMLDNGLFSNHSLYYTHYDFFSSLNFYGTVNWQRKKNDLVTTTDFQGINRFLTVLNIDPVNETLNGNLNIDKKFNKFKISAGGTWNSFTTNNLINDVVNQNKQFSQTYELKGTTTFFKKLEVDLSYNFTTNRYQGQSTKNTFNTHTPKIEIDLDIWKGLKLNADYALNTYNNTGADTQSEFDFLNAFLSYQGKSSPWEIRFTVWNILDTRSIRRDSFSDNLISTYSYLVQPRYGLITVKFDL
uniref:hypothetical protein n=1 Tax=Algoriphagus sp. TaxID=1872435 RepID=UPI0025E54C9E